MHAFHELLQTPAEEHRLRPGRVVELRGVIFQSDGGSTIGRLFIRPLEAIDRWIAGVLPTRDRTSLAMHAGVHVVLEDGREIVAEQLVGTLYMDLVSGLSWTPLRQFRERDRGGWDVTVPIAKMAWLVALGLWAALSEVLLLPLAILLPLRSVRRWRPAFHSHGIHDDD